LDFRVSICLRFIRAGIPAAAFFFRQSPVIPTGASIAPAFADHFHLHRFDERLHYFCGVGEPKEKVEWEMGALCSGVGSAMDCDLA
jgi:hypothetical protein